MLCVSGSGCAKFKTGQTLEPTTPHYFFVPRSLKSSATTWIRFLTITNTDTFSGIIWKNVLPCVFAHLSPFTLEMLDFTYWTVLILISYGVGWGEGVHQIQLFRERLSEKVHARILRGIVGGFEFSFFKEIWKNWHQRPWKCVCEC